MSEFPLAQDDAERPMYYVLFHGQPVPEMDFLRWMAWMATEPPDLRVAEDFVGETRISTIFLGMDHNHDREGPPILYETMVFTGKMDGEMWRYSTKEQAQNGHEQVVLMVIDAEGLYIEL